MASSDAVMRVWRVMEVMPSEVSRALAVYHPVMAQVLYNRGQDTREKARAFLEGGPDTLNNPLLMHGMQAAVGRIRTAIKRDELIAIYGDFDADGVTSTALLTQTLQTLGGRVMPYIPDRVDEGYGLNAEALDSLKAQGVSLVITVDCGIRAVEEVAHGNRIGLDMIVTDHHSVGEELPDALAVIDPKVDARLWEDGGHDKGYPEDMLAGVGVAYKLAEALVKVTEANDRQKANLNLEDLLDLVALGTVADLAPLDRLENRELVRRGLNTLNHARRPGVYELLQVARVEPGRISTTSIGYMLGPRINAAGRLGSAMVAYDLLNTRDITQAGELARRLQEINLLRQERTFDLVEEARERAFSKAAGDLPLIFDVGRAYTPEGDAAVGIVGLVAGRLCEEFYRPAVVVEQGDDESRGSCRSIPEFDITQALDQCADLLVRHGGHAQAAGFTVRNENIEALRERLMALAEEALRGQELRPVLDIDAKVPFDYLTMELAETLEQLEPTGFKNSAPVFQTDGLRVVDKRRVGQEGKHLKVRLTDGFRSVEGIGFKLGEMADALGPAVDVAYHLEINHWNGSSRLQLNIQDIRSSQ